MPGDITELLIAHRAGQSGALADLMPAVYADLRRIARLQLRGRRPGASLDTGGLVHDAYLRLVDQQRAGWNDRRHFFAVAALAMRQLAVDHARARARRKRGGGDRPATFRMPRTRSAATSISCSRSTPRSRGSPPPTRGW
jgi:RNA polymerase sigma-70 factor, ECF subfamily